jgi:hypothetical protein
MSDHIEQFGQDIYAAAYEECAYAEVEEGARDLAANLARKGYRKHVQLGAIAELDALSEGSVIRDRGGKIFQKIGSELWSSPVQDWGALTVELDNPVTVIYEPEVEE